MRCFCSPGAPPIPAALHTAPPDFIGTTFLKTGTPRADARARRSPARGRGRRSGHGPGLGIFSISCILTCGDKAGLSLKTSTDQRQLLNDGELDIYMAFNPGDASSAIALKFTSRHGAGAMCSMAGVSAIPILSPFHTMLRRRQAPWVTANFLLSPEAQARKQDPDVWGDPTVLECRCVDQGGSGVFLPACRGASRRRRPPRWAGPFFEPHPSWVDALEQRWAKRYAG